LLKLHGIQYENVDHMTAISLLSAKGWSSLG
jgi:hypothetical protein